MSRPSQLPNGWKLARFDQVMQRICDRSIAIDDSETYSCVGVRWYGNGAFVRERLIGLDIARKQQWVVRRGDVVYNKLFAWKGAFALADSDVDGCIVSDKFPLYRIDGNLLCAKYLECFFCTPEIARQAELLSKGAAAISKLTLNPPHFWELTVPLPSIAEQMRIVRRIEEIKLSLRSVTDLRIRAEAETRSLLAAYIDSRLVYIPHDATVEAVLRNKPRNGWSAPCVNAEDGKPVLSLGAVTGFEYRSDQFKRTSEPTFEGAHYWLHEGDLLMTRSNTPELVGHAAIYSGHPSPCIYPDLMMRLDVDEHLADKRFLHRWLMSDTVREFIRQAAKGTSPTMKKISQGVVMQIPFPRLSLAEQRRLAGQIESVRLKIIEAASAQKEVAVTIGAVMPSVLNAAFSGQL